MSRYYVPNKGTRILLRKVRKGQFSQLEGLKIRLIMDNKLKIDRLRGSIVFATVRAAKEVERHLIESVGGGDEDYFIFLNTLVWELAEEKDKKRILSHELRHIFVTEDNRCKIIKHDMEDFLAEIKLNADDPDWGKRLSTKVMKEYKKGEDEDDAFEF